MKKLILSLFVIFAANLALADNVPTSHDKTYTGVRSIGTLDYDVSSMCPPNAVCIVDGTVIDLHYLVDCTEDILSFEYDAIEKGDELHVYVSTVVGTNAKGPMACLAFSNQTLQVQLLNQFGKVVVHHLGIPKFITYP